MSNIVISGYYGFSNTGDESILWSIIKELKKNVEEVNITVLSNTPRETATRYGVNAVNRYSFWEIVRTMKKADLFISGGGSLLQDVTSIRSLFYYLGLISLARKMGVPVAVYSNGVGPLRFMISRWVTALVLNKVQHISVRDTASRRLLERIGVKLPIHTAADPVFMLKPRDSTQGIEILKKHKLELKAKQILMGISVRPWANQTAYREKIAKAADFTARELDAKIVFLPFNRKKDVEESLKIVELMEQEAVVIDEELDPEEMLNLVSCMDLLLGVRLHSLIFAAVAGVPFIGVSYDPKIDSFMEMFDMQPIGNLDGFELNDLLIEIESVLRSRESLKRNLEEKTMEMYRLVAKNNTRILDIMKNKERDRNG